MSATLIAQSPADVEPELNEKAVADAMELPADQRPDWLPEKFRNAEDLAKAYRELERRFHTEKPAAQTAEEAPETAEEVVEMVQETETTSSYGPAVDNAIRSAGLEPDALNKAWMETGNLTDEQFSALEKAGFSRATVEAYIAGATAKASEAVLGNQDIQAVYASVGGPESYGEMIKWAAANLSQPEIDAYNRMMNMGDPAAARIAAQGLHTRFSSEFGREPKLVQGGRTASAVKPYSTFAEMMKARESALRSGDPKEIAIYEQRALRSDW